MFCAFRSSLSQLANSGLFAAGLSYFATSETPLILNSSCILCHHELNSGGMSFDRKCEFSCEAILIQKEKRILNSTLPVQVSYSCEIGLFQKCWSQLPRQILTLSAFSAFSVLFSNWHSELFLVWGAHSALGWLVPVIQIIEEGLDHKELPRTLFPLQLQNTHQRYKAGWKKIRLAQARIY